MGWIGCGEEMAGKETAEPNKVGEFGGFNEELSGEMSPGYHTNVMGLLLWKEKAENWMKVMGNRLESLERKSKELDTVGLAKMKTKLNELADENLALKTQLQDYEVMFEDRVKKMNDKYVARAEQEIKQLREENDRLRNEMKASQNRTEKVEEDVVQMKGAWGNKVDQAGIQLKAIIEEQKEQQDNNIGKKVLNVIRQNEKQVSEIMDRKRCVVMFGDIEEEQVDFNIRKRNCLKKVDNMLKVLDKSGNEGWNKEVEDCWRLGKYCKGESRPLKIRLKSTKAAEEILSNSWKLS